MKLFAVLLVLASPTVAFHSVLARHSCVATSSLYATKTKQLTFDPLNLADDARYSSCREQTLLRPTNDNHDNDSNVNSAFAALARAGWASTALVPIVAGSQTALAVSSLSEGLLDPSKFQPVCPTSDGFYRFLQGSFQTIVGDDAFVEYGPLIAGGLLRVRLELCVVESFFKEAVGPFIEQNGVSWILPLHETVETFLAGAIFALATTFILIGSTKIVTVMVTYADILLGFPFRLLGGFVFDRATGKPVTLDIGFGKFKQRVVGPPEPKEGEKKDFSLGDANPGSLAVIFLSGAFRVTGQAVGVSTRNKCCLFA